MLCNNIGLIPSNLTFDDRLAAHGLEATKRAQQGQGPITL